MKKFVYSVYLLLFTISLSGQKNLFTPPVDIPIILNGNFGEIRPNHFHTGIDIKTNGTIGLPIFSAEDGFVSRIAISASGYGNVLYIDHPNGYTTVYAHLDRFSGAIADWVKKQQYEQKKFEVNLFPEPTLLPVKKGEKVAFSGNSGSSAGPHLHFEIRKTATDITFNPQFFNFNIKDNTKPIVTKIYVYPISKNGHVNNKNTKQAYDLVLFGENYRIKNMPLLNVFGEIGFGIDAIDHLDGNWSKCGIYQMELWVDDQLIHSYEMDEIDLNNNRCLNSHIDYEVFKRKGEKIQKCFTDPGNKLDIYKQVVNQGIYNFSDGQRHAIRIAFYDANMNAQKIEFEVQATSAIEQQPTTNENLFLYSKDNEFKTNAIEVTIPKGNLYTDIDFKFKQLPNPGVGYSPVFRLHDQYTPIDKTIEVKINADGLPEKLRDKAILGLIDITTNKISSLGGQYDRGWVKADLKTFGDMIIAVDTINPTIRSLSIKENALLEPDRIRFKIDDNLSGIASYDGFIDGNWVLFEYDAKNDLLTYVFDDNISKGKKHKIELLVKDKKANYKIFEANFNY